MLRGRVSICIPAHDSEHTISEALDSCVCQDYPFLEIIVSDNCSSDRTREIVERYRQVRLIKTLENIGMSANIENCINNSDGEYIMFLCADDILINRNLVWEIVKIFEENPCVGYIGRIYYQFMDGFSGAVRVHKTNNPYFAADNPSGLAFRKEALRGVKVSKKMFVESASIVKQVLDSGWGYKIINYYTTAVRIGNNGSQKPCVYTDSPLMNWVDLVGKDYFVLTSFISLVQIKNWSTYKNLLREIVLFIKLRPTNLLKIDFWLFSLGCLLIPKSILRRLVVFYKLRIGRLLNEFR